MTTLRVRLEVTFLTRLSNSRNFSLLPHEHRPFVVYGVSLCIRINFIATITKKTVVSCTYNNELWNYSNSSRWREKFLNWQRLTLNLITFQWDNPQLVGAMFPNVNWKEFRVETNLLTVRPPTELWQLAWYRPRHWQLSPQCSVSPGILSPSYHFARLRLLSTRGTYQRDQFGRDGLIRRNQNLYETYHWKRNIINFWNMFRLYFIFYAKWMVQNNFEALI